MAFSQHPKSLDTLLSSLIGDLGIQRQLDEARTVEGWATVAGTQINALTNTAWVKGDRLFVKITSAAWRHELHLQRRAWRDRLNEHLGANLVREIIFR